MKQIYRDVDVMVKEVERAVATTESAVRPIRDSVFKRYPVLFTLLVTFGVGATFFGIERIIMEISWLNARPWIIFLIGLSILTITGKLFKKLG